MGFFFWGGVVDLESFWFLDPAEKNWLKSRLNLWRSKRNFAWGQDECRWQESGFMDMFPSLSLRGEWTVILKGWEGRGPENQRKGDFFPNFYCHLDLTSDEVKGAGKIYRKSGFLRFLRNSKGLTLYCGSKHFNFSFHYWKLRWTDLGRDIMWASS